MKDQLIKYVDLLFAGASDSLEIKQEILQNTLDRYDDLIAQGKSPQAAYSLSIAGIGDVSELLQREVPAASHTVDSPAESKADEEERKRKRALAIGFYIISPIPLFLFSEFGLDTLGLCFTLLLVAAATALIIMSGKGATDEPDEETDRSVSTEDPMRQKIREIIRIMAIVIYFLVSLVTGAWLVTWLIFPLSRCISALIMACLDLKKEN